MDKLKEILNKDKKTSNLILIAILLVIVLIAMNYIFNETDESDKVATATLSANITKSNEDIETKLEKIITKIEGVKAASVMVSFSSTEKIIPVYDTKENIDTTTEQDKTSSKKTTEKTVAYEGEGNNKTALLESRETAEATGAIVVVTGSVTDEIKLDIKEAVSMVTNVSLHKVQVFIN